MEVLFRTRRLQRCATDEALAIREWVPVMGRRYTNRIALVARARTVQALFGLRALDFHPLTGDRAGQYALRLTGRIRLIVTLPGADTVLIEEVVDYHE